MDMEYTYLGNSGMKISKIGLGCMSFGNSNWRPWVLDEKESRPIIESAIDQGVNFFDTANMYSNGESERLLGSVLQEYNSDFPVVATKLYHDMDTSNPNASGLSRKSLRQELKNSLSRLGMDNVDLLQIHRWDLNTPIGETLSAMADFISHGLTNYIGASSMRTYQFATAQFTADSIGVQRFTSMQNHYNLVNRSEESEMIPFCRQEGVGLIPWSPLARGFLARPHREFDSSKRAEFMQSHQRIGRRLDRYKSDNGITVNERVEELADSKDVSMAQISIAWLLHQEAVDAPIVGVRSLEHLEDAIEAVDIKLSDDDLQYLSMTSKSKDEELF